MSRRKFTGEFKTRVALEALKERESLSVLAQKYELHPQQITNWKKELSAGASSVFSSPTKSKKTQSEEKEDSLHKIIGQQKVEINFLKNALS
jgi:transposase